MIHSVKQGVGVCWKSKFKNFLNLYNGGFGQVRMKTLEVELELWEEYVLCHTF